MQIWKEYNNEVAQNLLIYYNMNHFNELETLKDSEELSSLSYVAEGVDVNKKEFALLCQREIMQDIYDDKYMYMVAIEEMKNPNSKVENYKGLWRKISEKYDLKNIKLGKELKISDGEKRYFIGIARTNLENFSFIFSIMENKPLNYLFFISKKNYVNQNERLGDEIKSLLSFDKRGFINYINAINACIYNGDVVCRYGFDSIGMELDFILNRKVANQYFRERVRRMM